DAAQPLLAGEQAVPATGKRERHLAEMEARHLFDHVGLARDVARPPGGDGDILTRNLETELAEDAQLLVRRDLEPDQLVRPLGAETDDRPLGQLALRVNVARPARAGELEDELGGEGSGLRREMRVDALLPAVRSLGAQ